MLSHQTGVTPGLRTWLLDAVEKGIGIACVAEMISTQYIFGYEVRKRQYEAYCERGSQFNTTSFPAFHEYSTVPTRSLFYMIYKAASKLNEPHFERDRASIQIDYLSMDHTFRVSKKIGYTDSVSGKFIKQYNAICFVMNGKGQIVEYKLTGSRFRFIPEMIHVGPGVSGFIQVYPGLSRFIRDDPCWSRFIQVYPGLSRFIQVYPR